MKNTLIAVAVLIISVINIFAQQPVPNGGLEDWTLYPGQGSFKDYEEPNEGWSSGNGAIHIAAGSDPVLLRSDDARSGANCAQLVTRRIFGQIASGSLYTGKFSLNLADPASSAKLGIPFSGKPTRFKCWYKFIPQGGDSSSLRLTLSRWDGEKRVKLGEAEMTVYSAVIDWTELNLEIEYFSDQEPDTIVVVFASSAGGGLFTGDVGSTLFVDDISVSYDPVSVDNATDFDERLRWEQSSSSVVLGSENGPVSLSILNIQGNLIHTLEVNPGRTHLDLPSGVYIVVASGVGWRDSILISTVK